MPDNDKRRIINDDLTRANDNIKDARYHLTVNHRGTARDKLIRARSSLSAAIDLLDHDRQPVDGSPPDAAD